MSWEEKGHASDHGTSIRLSNDFLPEVKKWKRSNNWSRRQAKKL
jgi:hypothetical protein